MTDKKIIEALIAEELAEANKVHPMFHSGHEAYGVIKEELEEAEAEMAAVKEYFDMMWENVKNDFDCSSFLKQARGHALFLIQESIQLAAMLQKALDSQEESL